jgi:hypothetical protein
VATLSTATWALGRTSANCRPNCQLAVGPQGRVCLGVADFALDLPRRIRDDLDASQRPVALERHLRDSTAQHSKPVGRAQSSFVPAATMLEAAPFRGRLNAKKTTVQLTAA